MHELSLYVLDIVQNSLSAGASLVEIFVDENTVKDQLIIRISDNGCGMTADQLRQVSDPFYTTRTTRRVGMGVPLFRLAAEQTGGSFDINSIQGQGTVVTAVFVRSHIDLVPLGDMESTITSLIRLNPDKDFCYKRVLNQRSFEIDTRNLRKILEDVSLDTPEVITWIGEYIREQNIIITGGTVPDKSDL